MDPLVLVLIAAGIASAFCWIASLITKDTSWVDRLWSIVPVVYVWIFAIAGITAGDDAVRLIVMAVLVSAWGARLTFNFARKGGYTGMEDYRWAILRGRMKPWQFQLFNLFFIVLYQNALLVLIWALSGGGSFWPIWVIGFWGLGLAVHAWNVYGQRGISEADVQREMRKGGDDIVA